MITLPWKLGGSQSHLRTRCTPLLLEWPVILQSFMPHRYPKCINCLKATKNFQHLTLMSLRNQGMWLLIICKMIYRILALFALLIWKLPVFEQVTVNASGERLENNFVNPTYRGDQRVTVINTSADNTKPVQVTQAAHWMIVKSLLILRTFVTTNFKWCF